MDTSDTINNAILKARQDPNFGKDLIKFMKYLAIKDCPDEKLAELNRIIAEKNLQNFFTFSSQNIPDFPKKVVEYINSY